MSPRYKLRITALYAITIIVVLDLLMIGLVRIFADATPVVAGDVSKFGLGILAGALMTPGRPSPQERKKDGE